MNKDTPPQSTPIPCEKYSSPPSGSFFQFSPPQPKKKQKIPSPKVSAPIQEPDDALIFTFDKTELQARRTASAPPTSLLTKSLKFSP